MGACALLALVVAAGAARSVWSSVSNQADKRGALRQEDEALRRASAGVDYVAPYNQGGRDKCLGPCRSRDGERVHLDDRGGGLDAGCTCRYYLCNALRMAESSASNDGFFHVTHIANAQKVEFCSSQQFPDLSSSSHQLKPSLGAND